tara:strand:+ start:2413 stop:2904 length:492 start_codon:yes stop_codon:yes gene_type:complete
MSEEGLGSVASDRSARKNEDHPKVWTPPNKLETPAPPEGMIYRWVRYSAGGDGDDGNVYDRARQGYQTVMKEELKGWIGDHVRVGRGEHVPEGAVRQGDLILMKVSEDIANQRSAYYRKQARTMQQAVDQELDGLGSANMPIVRESSSTVSQGRPKTANIDED